MSLRRGPWWPCGGRGFRRNPVSHLSQFAEGIAFGLNVNPVEPERVLINDAINAVIAATAKCAASLGGGAAKPHAQNQIDDKALKKIGRGDADSIKQILRKGRLDLPVCREHN